jgi:hypothetical protein
MNPGSQPVPEIPVAYRLEGKVLFTKNRLNIGIYWECLLGRCKSQIGHSVHRFIAFQFLFCVFDISWQQNER